MNALVQTPTIERPTVEVRKGESMRLQPVRAFKAISRLMKDKEDTHAVFDLMRALSGKTIPKGYARLIKSPQGGRIAYYREELAERLMDRPWLDSFAPGTVGAAYRDFIDERGFTADGLAEISQDTPDAQIEAAHPLVWYGRRMRDLHDVWHTLTGYRTDALGEACVVAFSYSQTGALGFKVIAEAASLKLSRSGNGQPYAAAIRQAFRHGKAAAWLPEVDYPALFAEDLEAARARLNIKSPTIYQSIPAEMRDGLFKAH
ncbi:MAG: ubiquinone biosynthesis protein [Caulobacter sp.]|nr:ubiquinone biosynthesis protein [Caulobacter sp.]